MEKFLLVLLSMVCLGVVSSCGGNDSSGNGDKPSTLDPNKPTEELVMTLNDDGASYTAHGYGPATGLKNIVVPAIYEGLPVTALDDFAHGPLENIYIPEGILMFGSQTFANCYNLKSITIPSTVTEIPRGLFQNCTGLVEVVLYDGITSIYDDAFLGCSSLKELFIPDSVTYIQGSVFQGCSSLESISIPRGVYNLDDNIFDGCSSLKTISFYENLTIGKYGFNNCTSLESFAFPVTAKSISAFLFSGCTSLKEVVIPASVTKIGYDAFANCTSLENVYFEGSEEDWNKITIDTTNDSNSCLFNANIVFNHVR